MTFSRNENWNNQKWMNDLKIASAELDSGYATDMLEAVADKSFSTLEAALDDLRLRTGLSSADIKSIHLAALEIHDPLTFKAMETVASFGPKELGLLKEAYDKKQTLPETTKAIEILGINKAWDEKSIIKEAGELPEGLRKWKEEQDAKKNDEKPEDKKEEDKEEDKEVKAACKCKKNKSCKCKKGVKKMKKTHKAEWSSLFNKNGIKKAWFEGSNEPTVEGNITSNDPNKLGAGSKDGIQYDRKPMAVPVGEDSRPFEQKKFEGEANETKKVMGPQGTELELKKKLQRAKWNAFLKK